MTILEHARGGNRDAGMDRSLAVPACRDGQRAGAAGLGRLGVGTWPLPHDGLRLPGAERVDETLRSVLQRAFEMGIDWIDTAHSYDDGAAEEAVGRFVSGLPADVRPIVLTKGGVVRDMALGRPRPVAVLRPSVIRAQLEASLRRLRREAADVYLLHYPDMTGVPVEESWGEVLGLVREGLIGMAGLCGFADDDIRRCAAEGGVDVVMQRLTPLCPEDGAAHLRLCRDLGVDLIVWNPGQTGRLLDPAAAGPLSGTPLDTPRDRLRALADADIGREIALTAALRHVAARHGVTPEAIVVAWQLSHEDVTAVAMGVYQAAHVDASLPGLTVSLSADDLREIDDASRSSPAMWRATARDPLRDETRSA